ncbi:MAG: cation:proton antiporter [Ktedonobacteraceae bacterium]
MIDIVAIVRILVLLLLIALIVILVTRRLAVPYTLGLVIVGLAFSLLGLLPAVRLTPQLVLFVFLPALLFEGSWTIEVQQLRKNWVPIFLLAVPGLLLSLLLIAAAVHFLAALPWSYALLLGAILSPTDPIAVLGLFRQLKVNPRLATIIEGESLFNDGIAGALYQTFLALLLLSLQGNPTTGIAAWVSGFSTFALEAGGGIVLGLICGFLLSRFVGFIDDPLIETTITLIAAYGVYLLADTLHLSGIIALIVATLIFGSYGRRIGMSEQTRVAVDNFWSIIAFIANSLLFLLVGAELNPLRFFTTATAFPLLLTAGVVIIAVLVARLAMVLMLRFFTHLLRGALLFSWRFVIFWSGLRGALSLALVLALPVQLPMRDELIFSTYVVVLFTLLVQGLSLRFILRRLSFVD